VVQWLRHHASNAGGVSLIPGWGPKIPRAAWCSQKRKEEQRVPWNNKPPPQFKKKKTQERNCILVNDSASLNKNFCKRKNITPECY
jgi:hypothetical protein